MCSYTNVTLCDWMTVCVLGGGLGPPVHISGVPSGWWSRGWGAGLEE